MIRVTNEMRSIRLWRMIKGGVKLTKYKTDKCVLHFVNSTQPQFCLFYQPRSTRRELLCNKKQDVCANHEEGHHDPTIVLADPLLSTTFQVCRHWKH